VRILPGLLAVLVVAGGIFTASPAGAVGPCTGVGVTASGVYYGTCVGDLGGGSVMWSNDGSTVSMKAEAHPTPHDAVSWWETNGPLPAGTTLVCFDLNVSSLNLLAGATAKQVLIISYNNQQQSGQTWSVTRGSISRCGIIPGGVSNIWAQVLTVVTAARPGGSGYLTQTLVGLRVA